MRSGRLLMFVVFMLASSEAWPAPSRIELQARQAFGASRYQEALELYATLYAEKLHPVYLRNIGRCYQNLGDPDKAISSFREYLRKANHLSSDEKAEIEGFIAEMKALKNEGKLPEPTPAEPVAAPAPPPAPQFVPQPAPLGTAALTTSAKPNEDMEAQEPSVFAKPWFWGVVATLAIGAVVGGLAASGAFTTANDAPCEMGRVCAE